VRNFNLKKLTESVRLHQNKVSSETKRLTEKWAHTGLLQGLGGPERDNMARLLENQAMQLLRETSEAGADLRGFQNIAFPIVRRVFGGLIANELVSVQPMSLPSGLIFYLDFTYGSRRPGFGVGSTPDSPFVPGESVYGDPSGEELQWGASGSGGMYNLVGNTYSKVHVTGSTINKIVSGTFGANWTMSDGQVSSGQWGEVDRALTDSNFSGSIATGGTYMWVVFPVACLTGGIGGRASTAMDLSDLESIWLLTGTITSTVQRFTRVGQYTNSRWNDFILGQTSNRTHILSLVSGTLNNGMVTPVGGTLSASFVVPDTLTDSYGDGSINLNPAWESDFNTTTNPIPEIDIKVESTAVTAVSRKLRARRTPELAQDLNAYHNLDAEVELTQILSEQIALEIDNEILGDLLMLGTGANYFWSRVPGKFVDKTTGQRDQTGSFTGTVHEWYETLVETIIDVANVIHRKTLRGAANFMVVSPDVATILESTTSYNANIDIDKDGQPKYPGGLGVVNMGSIRNRFVMYKSPYFPRNKVLVGYKGNPFLETGFVYAPYVPLITTPIIYDPEEFTPRRGVMCRYGKKLVRSDFYGSVTTLDMNII
jgi:hypothetical protein